MSARFEKYKQDQGWMSFVPKPTTRLAIFLAICGVLGSIITSIEGGFNLIDLLFLIFLVPLILVIIFRKWLFTKFVIDEKGIAYLFRKKEIKRIIWEEVAEIRFYLGDIIVTGQAKQKKLKCGLSLRMEPEEVQKVLNIYFEKHPNIPVKKINWKGKKVSQVKD